VEVENRLAYYNVRLKAMVRNYSTGVIHNTPFSEQLTNGNNKPDCYITLGWKDL
jgi:hypothetical protein